MRYLKLDNWRIYEITEKDIKEKDFLYKIDWLTIIDEWNRTARPIIEDLLNQMDIETTQIKFIKKWMVLNLFSLIWVFIILFFSFSISWKVTKMIDTFSKIEKIQEKKDWVNLFWSGNILNINK